MPSKRPLMRLSRDEEVFLRHWMYDEVHGCREGEPCRDPDRAEPRPPNITKRCLAIRGSRMAKEPAEFYAEPLDNRL